MTPTLRDLFVHALILSTALVGLRDAFASVSDAVGVTCFVAAKSFQGSREDDSGTRAEEVEGEDEDQDEKHDTLLCGGAARSCRPDLGVGSLIRSPLCRAAHLLCRGALVRGPPSSC